MNWINDLLWGEGIGHSILLLSFVIAAGIQLGKIKVFGVSQGGAPDSKNAPAGARCGFGDSSAEIMPELNDKYFHKREFAEDGINTVQVVASAVCGVCLPLLVCKDQVSRRCQNHGIYPGVDGCYPFVVFPFVALFQHF